MRWRKYFHLTASTSIHRSKRMVAKTLKSTFKGRKGCLSLALTPVIGTKASGGRERFWKNFGNLEGQWQGAVKRGSQKTQTGGGSLGPPPKSFRKFLLSHHSLRENWGRFKVSNLGHCGKNGNHASNRSNLGGKEEHKIHFPHYFHTLWNSQRSWVVLSWHWPGTEVKGG